VPDPHPGQPALLPRNPKTNQRARKRKPSPLQGLAAFLPQSTVSLFDDPESPSLKFLKLLVGLILLPVCWLMLETFLVLLQADTLAASYWKSSGFLYFGVGCLLWLVLFLFARCRPMMWLYVAGHELTHALFVLICRGKVSKVHISADGGHVMTNRNNFVISLSPYFFPFYTAVAIVMWGLMEWTVADLSKPDTVWLYGLIGFTWMFHLTFTLWMIRRDQPDVNQNGRIFSFTIIFIANVLLICAMLIVASPTATFRGFTLSLLENTRTFYPRLVESVSEVYAALPF